MQLRYAVIGTGALGGYYGGRLANSGKEVHFLFRNDYNQVLESGLKVDSVAGDFHLKKINAYKTTSDMPVCDVVLVCLKTTANGILPRILPPLLHERTVVLLIQNGLGMESELASQMPDINIAGALAFICSSKFSPGHITHVDYGRVELGSYKGDNDEILKQVCEDFTASGVDCKFTDDLQLARWKKLVWNIPYNGLSVILNATTKQMMENENSYELIKEIMLEVIAAARACGSNIGDNFAKVMLDYTNEMKPYAPSMRLDYDNKRQLEIECIYSNPVIEAQKQGYEMTRVALLEKQLKFIESQYLK